jgi:hypothetical protein
VDAVLPLDTVYDQRSQGVDLGRLTSDDDVVLAGDGLRRPLNTCRFSPGILVRVELATGTREESILTMARWLPADLLILAWSGMPEANGARTVRSICAVAPCPVLLVARPGRGSVQGLSTRRVQVRSSN